METIWDILESLGNLQRSVATTIWLQVTSSQVCPSNDLDGLDLNPAEADAQRERVQSEQPNVKS